MLFGLKKEGNPELAMTWVNLEDVMLSEISQPQKANTVGFHSSAVPSRRHIRRDRKQKGGRQGLGRGWGVSVYWGKSFSLGRRKALWTEGGDGDTARMYFTPLS